MPHAYDPEVEAAIRPMLDRFSQASKIPPGDVLARRAAMDEAVKHFNPLPYIGDVTTKDYQASATDGQSLLVRWFTKTDAPTTAGPAILFVHGGGMILGNVKMFQHVIAGIVSMSGVPFAAVEYRVAPEHPHPTLVEDCYAGLTWLRDNAKELNVDPSRIGIMGESAGGGIAAGVTLMARDRKFTPPLAKSILIYPMLDDRNTVLDEKIAPFALWNYDDNITGWGALLGKDVGGENVSPYAAPARATDLSGLPPTYIDVGQLDIFVYEDMEYANRIARAGGTVEFHLHPGCLHGYDTFASQADVSKRAIQDRVRVIKSI
jgi:acetyl esterase/lipase